MIDVKDFQEGIEKIWCNTCKRDTNHFCKAKHCVSYDERKPAPNDHLLIWWESNTAKLMICAGCETPSLKIEFDTVEHCDGPDISIYPKRETRQLPIKVFRKLPDSVKIIYRESVRAFNSECYILCTVGLRALIEGICEEKGIKGKNIENKIAGLNTILPQGIVDNLHRFRFMGNKAAHDLISPKNDELRIAIDVCEDLMNYLYELDYKSSMLIKHEKVEMANNPPLQADQG